MSGSKDSTVAGPLEARQRHGDLYEAVQTHLDGRQAAIHTAMPGIVQSFDAKAMTLKVQPAIQGMQTMTDGSVKPVTITAIKDVPVHFPGGGGYTLTFPITKDDEAQLIFQSRSMDYWHQLGGTQKPSDWRMHDINDAVAMVGLRSTPRALKEINTKTVQLRSDDGKRFVEIDNGNDRISVITPDSKITVDNKSAKITLNTKQLTVTLDDGAGTVEINAPTEVKLTCPKITCSGTLYAKDVFSDTISGKLHTHPGVQAGPSKTLPPTTP